MSRLAREDVGAPIEEAGCAKRILVNCVCLQLLQALEISIAFSPIQLRLPYKSPPCRRWASQPARWEPGACSFFVEQEHLQIHGAMRRLFLALFFSTLHR